MNININSVFNGISVPTDTYVAQENGKFETLLRQGVREEGTLCLITGSSKTGKTSLYNKVLKALNKTPILVRCDRSLASHDFWKRPLETIDFSRVQSTESEDAVELSSGVKVGGNIGWPWLANLLGEVNLGLKGTASDIEIREKILSNPSAHHLIPLLKKSNAILVVEDFHYLNEIAQQEIFQQWKIFTDNQVSVIVVGTTHHGVDLAYANSDLIGRIKHIDLGRWSDNDLQDIARKGCTKLGITFQQTTYHKISKECAGLPILMQQVCAQLFYDRDIETWKFKSEISFDGKNAENALHNVATTRYAQFENWYSRLTIGPRLNARKYDTYSLILALFTQDPPKFQLHRHEIDDRLAASKLDPQKTPPSASINSTLAALAKFQRTNGFELLEWNGKDKTIYILEPAFLFYLRWRVQKTKSTTVFESVLLALLIDAKEIAETFNKIKKTTLLTDFSDMGKSKTPKN